MSLRLPLFLANRLPLRSGGGSGVAVAVTGVALAIAVMLVAVAVMVGFKEQIREKIIGFDSQISISPKVDLNTTFPLISLPDIADALAQLPDSVSATVTVRQPTILKTTDGFSGAVIKGVDENYDWSFLRNNLVEGVIPDYRVDSTLYHIVISRPIASDLSLSLGDRVDTYFLGDGTYRTRRLKIAGIYDTHFAEYDRTMVFATLPMLQQVGGFEDGQGSVIEIGGLPTDEAIDSAAATLSDILMREHLEGKREATYHIINIHDSAALYFNWLHLLDTNVSVILTLMSLLGALTLVSSLFILVLRRVNMIGILKALGASNRLVRQMFILMTMRLLLLGLLCGNALGLLLVEAQSRWGIVPLDPEAYYLDHVPVHITWESVIILNASAIVISALVLLLPSAIIATIKPSRAINYE